MEIKFKFTTIVTSSNRNWMKATILFLYTVFPQKILGILRKHDGNDDDNVLETAEHIYLIQSN